MVDFIATPFAFGDIEKLKTAGAQSVLIAVPFFSARGAACFPIEELPDIKAECVRCQISLYVLVNRIFVEEELERLRDFLKLLKELDVEGIYYGDEGVLYEAARLDMKDRLIYNPDTLITNAMDMQYYLDEGIRMATISKEITLQEMCTVARDVQGECEVVLHGRLNMMHSKRKLLSAYMEFLGKEEAVTDNHQLYLMEETRDDHMPIVEDALGTHVFTGFTLVSFEEIRHPHRTIPRFSNAPDHLPERAILSSSSSHLLYLACFRIIEAMTHMILFVFLFIFLIGLTAILGTTQGISATIE